MGLIPGRGVVPSGDARGQSAPIGVALILGVVVVGTVSVVVFGGAALEDTQSQSELSRAEQLMTLFDSRTAMVALGDSDVQTTNLPGGGTHTVDSDAGRIRLVHVGYNNGTDDETIYDDTMGAMIFERGTTTFAYQGGGVWRKDRSGDARMVTPPEFQYRQSTLTFPLIRITSDDSGSGGVTATASARARAVPIYPNQTGTYDDGSPYNNPLENGSLVVWVESEYYEGWAQYFRDRTDAQVTTFDGNNTVKANLVSLGNRGEFDMPKDGNGIRVAGLSGAGHSLQNFTITITDDPDDQAKFNNLQWSMYVDNGQRELEFNIRDGGTINGDDYVELSVYYSEDGGDTYHGWQNNTAFKVRTGDIHDDGTDDEYVVVNFTTLDQTLEATEIQSDDLVHFDNPSSSGDYSGNGTQRWDGHDGSVSWESTQFDLGDKTTVYNVTAHYMEMVGDDYQLVVDDKSGDRVDEDSSYGRIVYPGSDQYIAYLHVTKNEVSVSLS